MPITWNEVTFHETPLVEGGPDFSFMPRQESRYSMRGWFDWQDMAQPQVAGVAQPSRAGKAYCGWCQVTPADGWTLVDGNGVPLTTVQDTLPVRPQWSTGLTFFNYTNPFPHPDWANQMYLCEGFSQVRGSIPNSPSIGANGTATFDEAHTTLSFRSPKNGYRTLFDFQCLDTVGFFNQQANVGGNVLIPREYYCIRNMEIIQKTTSRSQTIPPNDGLVWKPLGANGQPLAGNFNVSSMNFIALSEGEITIKWYPVPIGAYNEAGATELIGKSNQSPFPPPHGSIRGIPGTSSLLPTRFAGTLVWGQPEPEIIRMGDCSWALSLTFRLKWFPFGANAFFWWNPPANARGRIRIDALNGPTSDRTLGGPGYYTVGRTDGTPLFPSGDYRQPFLPKGQTS